MMPKSAIRYVDFAVEVLRLNRPPIRRPATFLKQLQVLGEFRSHCTTAADVSPAAIADWLVAHPGRSSLTSFSLLRSFATATAAGAALGLLKRDPFTFRAPARWFATGALEPPEKQRHHSAEVIARVLAQAAREATKGTWEAQRLNALVNTYAFTAMRKNEALGLELEDIDLAARVIRLAPNERRVLKTSASRRRLPIPTILADVLGGWIPQCHSETWIFPHKLFTGPWLTGRPGKKPLDEVKALGLRAGVSGFTILSIRHSFATAAEMWEFSDLMLQRYLGHGHRRTQRSYRHDELGQLLDAAELICYH